MMSPAKFQRYLDRIGYQSQEEMLKPSIETLRTLHEAHVSNIPFENMDVFIGRDNLTIGATGEAPLLRKFGVQPLGKVKFAFVVSPDHPLAKQPEPLQNQDILSYRGIAVADTSRSLTPRGSGILAEQNLLIVPNLQAKLEAHRVGLGVGFMPIHRIKEDVASGRLLIKEVVKAKPDALLTIAWDIAQSGKATEWFLKKLSTPKNCKELIS